MAKTYANGVRDGKTDATLEDVRADIAELKRLVINRLWCVSANSATIGLLAVSVGFLYLAVIRGWL